MDNLEHYPDLYECLGYAHFLNENHGAAEDIFAALLAENEDNLFARMGMMKILALKGDFETLQAYAERYQEVNPTEKVGELLEALK